MSMPAGFTVDDKIVERKSEYNKNSHATSLTVTSKFEKANLANRGDSKIGEEHSEDGNTVTEGKNREAVPNLWDGVSSFQRVKISGNPKDVKFTPQGSVYSQRTD